MLSLVAVESNYCYCSIAKFKKCGPLKKLEKCLSTAKLQLNFLWQCILWSLVANFLTNQFALRHWLAGWLAALRCIPDTEKITEAITITITMTVTTTITTLPIFFLSTSIDNTLTEWTHRQTVSDIVKISLRPGCLAYQDLLLLGSIGSVIHHQNITWTR